MSLLSDILDPSRNKGAMRLIARPLYSWSLAGGTIPDRLVMLPPDPWTGDSGKGRWISNRVLDYAGTHISLEPQAWAAPENTKSHKRCMAVHGFEWLRDLRALGTDGSRRFGRQLMQEWMDANTRWQEGVWDNSITAQRVASWLTGYEFFCASGDDAFLARFYASLIRQVRHLDRAQPEHSEGLDALCIIKALIFGGLALEGGATRLQAAQAWLESWLADEVDTQGMHISRNPANAVAMAKMLIEIRSAQVRAGIAASPSLQSAIDRSMHAIRFFRMPDGRMACFQGCGEGDSSELDTVLKISGVRIRKPLSQLEECGFESLVRERVTVLADCGYPAPHPYDRQAHASPFAFEMSVGRDRMVVNCGTHETDATWADHLRATAAHSGLTVDDRNAMEIKADGHVGRAPNQMTLRRDIVQGGVMISMSHDGYVPLNNLVHTRRLGLSADGRVLEGEDGLVSDAPLMKPASYAIRFHLHPKVQASLIQDGQAALLRLPSGAGWRFSKKAGTLSLEPSVYCGAGGAPRKTQQLVLSGTTDGSVTLVGWAFSEEG